MLGRPAGSLAGAKYGVWLSSSWTSKAPLHELADLRQYCCGVLAVSLESVVDSAKILLLDI